MKGDDWRDYATVALKDGRWLGLGLGEGSEFGSGLEIVIGLGFG